MSHNLFKVFKGNLGDIAAIKSKLESFVDTNKVSARSIGIEFIEASKEVIISLGYSKDGSHVPVTIDAVSLGKVDLNDTDKMENLMSSAADKQKNVICHELCITDTKELMMLFMSTK
jgi:hypothetical protein